jgi:hypothetical protein
MEDVSINLQEEMASVDDQRHRQLNNNQYGQEEADYEQYDVDDEDCDDDDDDGDGDKFIDIDSVILTVARGHRFSGAPMSFGARRHQRSAILPVARRHQRSGLHWATQAAAQRDPSPRSARIFAAGYIGARVANACLRALSNLGYIRQAALPGRVS